MIIAFDDHLVIIPRHFDTALDGLCKIHENKMNTENNNNGGGSEGTENTNQANECTEKKGADCSTESCAEQKTAESAYGTAEVVEEAKTEVVDETQQEAEKTYGEGAE